MHKKRIGILTETLIGVRALVDAAKNLKKEGIKIKETNLGDLNFKTTKKRALFSILNCDVIVRCIKDMLAPENKEIEETLNMNSAQQYFLIPGYLKYDNLDLVFSFSGTGSTPSNQKEDFVSINGSVFLGANFFCYNALENKNSFSNQFKPIVMSVSCVNKKIFSLFSEVEKKEIVGLFKTVLNKPSKKLQLNINYNNFSITVSNAMDPSNFKVFDLDAYKKARYILGEKNFVSVNTTHAIVNMSAIKACELTDKKIPAVFVSAIENRFLYYEEDVGKNTEQEYLATYNGAITILKLILKISQFNEELYY